MGEVCQCLTELSARNMIMAGYYSLTFLFAQWKQIYQTTNECCISYFSQKIKTIYADSHRRQFA